MRAILKKELKSYFLSPIGYVVIGIFLLCFMFLLYYLRQIIVSTSKSYTLYI